MISELVIEICELFFQFRINPSLQFSKKWKKNIEVIFLGFFINL